MSAVRTASYTQCELLCGATCRIRVGEGVSCRILIRGGGRVLQGQLHQAIVGYLQVKDLVVKVSPGTSHDRFLQRRLRYSASAFRHSQI